MTTRMTVLFQVHRSIRVFRLGILGLGFGLASCSAPTSPTSNGNSTANPCAVGRPATLTMTGAPTTFSSTYNCGSVQITTNPSIVSVSFFPPSFNNGSSITVPGVPGTYAVLAANAGKVDFNDATTFQTGFCQAPSGTIAVTSYTSPGPINDASVGRIAGTFTNVTLCDSSGKPTFTVSGSYVVN